MHLLGRWLCVKVEDIVISTSGTIFVDGVSLSLDEANLLAWRNGFRPVGSSEGRPGPAFELFFRYWRTLKQNGKKRALPFSGDIIHWDYRRITPWPKPRTK